ncbi:MAG: hypothetical protein J7L15_02510, partial [Clostridiales bacterium]|nr:hypothetical protein [Clostridiales bacterium]
VRLKAKAAMKFCQEKGYEYRIEDVVILTISEIKKLCDENKVVFTKRYEEKFRKMLKGFVNES